MSPSPQLREVYRTEQVAELAAPPRAVFLSSSLPSKKHIDDGRPYAAEIHRARARRLIKRVCERLLENGYGVVFGGHPEVTPIVLAIARDASSAAAPRVGDEAGGVDVLVFQSGYFRARKLIRPETYELADWSRGSLIWTAEAPGGVAPSLTFMRECMTRVASLVGAVVIGGMDGLFEEVALFEKNQPGRPVYPVASAGGAASYMKREGVPDEVNRLTSSEDAVADAILLDLDARQVGGPRAE